MQINSIYQSVIEILDTYLNEAKIDFVLRKWAIKHRFAGSSDRRKIKDIIFDIIRQKKSCEHVGGGFSGRNLLIGYLKLKGTELSSVFDNSKFGPEELTIKEQNINVDFSNLSNIYELDFPSWLIPILRRSLLNEFSNVVKALRNRSHIQLRVNLKKISRLNAMKKLQKNNIECEINELCSTALNVLNGAQHILTSQCFENGFVELQDAGSQLVSKLIEINYNDKVLDMCAGAGGKSLSISCGAELDATYFAWDINFDRMKDIDARSKRAGVKIEKVIKLSSKSFYNKIIIDAPCSGSGSWRRDPEGKWRLDEDILDNYVKTQRELILKGLKLLAPRGQILYITCSILDIENGKLIDDLISSVLSLRLVKSISLVPSSKSDGFYGAVLEKV
jgi:16S rRNA (cytosine967-C5)-methyltransferase